MIDKRFTILFLSLLLIFDTVYSECTDEKGNPIETTQEGVGGFFHDLGCSIQRGAKKIGEGALKLGEKETWQKFGENIEEGAKKISDADTWKNLGDDISEGAKRFGTQVKDKFSDIKDKISGSSSEEVHKNKSSNITNQNQNQNTELPYMIDIRSSLSMLRNIDINSSSFNSSGSGEHAEQSPTSFDDRFLTNTPKRCPDGQAFDDRGICRKIRKV